MAIDWDIILPHFNTYENTVLATSLILIVLYTGLLYHIWKGSKYYFLILLTILLIISNIAAILADIFANKYHLGVESIFVFIRDSTFNLAHWIFCYKYWVIACDMEDLL